MRSVYVLSFTGIVLFCGCNAPPPDTAATPATSSASLSTLAAKPPDPANAWEVQSDVNALDGKKKITISAHNVYIRCGSRFDGYVVPNLPQLGHTIDTDSDRTSRVRYRLDGSAIKSGRWGVSDDFSALFFPTSLLHSIIRSKTLVLEYRPEYTTAMTETFDLSGLQIAAERAGCEKRK